MSRPMGEERGVLMGEPGGRGEVQKIGERRGHRGGREGESQELVYRDPEVACGAAAVLVAVITVADAIARDFPTACGPTCS